MRLSLHCFACSMTLATPQGLIAQVAILLVLCNFPDLFRLFGEVSSLLETEYGLYGL